MKAANRQVAVLTGLVVMLAVLNVVQLAMTPTSASAENGGKPVSVAKYRGGERAATTDAVKEVNVTLQNVLAEIKGLRTDLTAGKLSVRIKKAEVE